MFVGQTRAGTVLSESFESSPSPLLERFRPTPTARTNTSAGHSAGGGRPILYRTSGLAQNAVTANVSITGAGGLTTGQIDGALGKFNLSAYFTTYYAQNDCRANRSIQECRRRSDWISQNRRRLCLCVGSGSKTPSALAIGDSIRRWEIFPPAPPVGGLRLRLNARTPASRQPGERAGLGNGSSSLIRFHVSIGCGALAGAAGKERTSADRAPGREISPSAESSPQSRAPTAFAPRADTKAKPPDGFGRSNRYGAGILELNGYARPIVLRVVGGEISRQIEFAQGAVDLPGSESAGARTSRRWL